MAISSRARQTQTISHFHVFAHPTRRHFTDAMDEDTTEMKDTQMRMTRGVTVQNFVYVKVQSCYSFRSLIDLIAGKYATNNTQRLNPHGTLSSELFEFLRYLYPFKRYAKFSFSDFFNSARLFENVFSQKF